MKEDDTIWLGWDNNQGSHSTRTSVRTAKEIWAAIWKDCIRAEIWDNSTLEKLGDWSRSNFTDPIYLVFCAENGQPTSFFGSTRYIEDAVPMARRAAKTANFTLAEIWETKLGSSSSSKVRTIHRKDL